MWNFLFGAAVLMLLLATGWSARLRGWAERRVRFKPIQTIIYWAGYAVVTTVLPFPLTVYERFFREHAYGLSNQTFAAWLGDSAKLFGVHLVQGAILVPVLYGLVRRLGRTWWIWATVVTDVFVAFFLFISPVVIAPLFNKHTPISDERIREPILRMARANGIRAQEIYVVDESRQSKRISGNVSGFLGTERISLNDNLLKRTSLPEIEAVMGHEMGHYLLNQINNFLMFFALYFGAGFAGVNWGFHRALRQWGGKWGVRGIDDPAGFPLGLMLGMIFFFVTSPILKSFIRSQEYEADIFGLNASRQPDGFAEVTLKLSEYRKLNPGPLEEWIFYDHPSGRLRIYTAMRWKAENMTQ